MQRKLSIFGAIFSLLAVAGWSPAALSSEPDTISITLNCPENFALPSDAIGYLTLTDVSPRQDISIRTIARQIIHEPCKGTMRFELAYDPTKIWERHHYAIQAQIASAGRVILSNSSAHMVITQGNPTVVEIDVEQLDYP